MLCLLLLSRFKLTFSQPQTISLIFLTTLYTRIEWVDTVQYCFEHNITVTAYNSLGGSLQHHETQTIDTLQQIATIHKRTVAQIMLRWSIQTGTA